MVCDKSVAQELVEKRVSFAAAIFEPNDIDEHRRFIFTYYLDDNSVAIYEPPIKYHPTAPYHTHLPLSIQLTRAIQHSNW